MAEKKSKKPTSQATKSKKTHSANKSVAKPVLSVAKKKDVIKAAQALDEEILRWKTPDYYTFEKSPYWSLGVGVLAIVFSLILIYTNNYFPVIIIILAVIVTFQVAHDKPKPQEFAVDEGGILERNQYISYLELKSFWITTHETKPILYLEPLSSLRAPIVIPLSRQNSAEVRVFLLRFLPEKMEYGELWSDKLMRIFRL